MVNKLGMEYDKELGENEMSGYESDKSKYLDNRINLMAICKEYGLTPCIESYEYDSGYECCYCGREGVVMEESLD